MTRLWRVHMSVLLVGLLLVSRLSCESSVVDDEDDDEENLDEMETSGTGVGSSNDDASAADTAERPDVNTYRDDQTNRNSNVQQQQQQQQPQQHAEETTADSSYHVNPDSDDLDADSEGLDENIDSNEYNGGELSRSDGDTSSSSSSDQQQQQQQKQPPAASANGQHHLFTYQNNRSKLLNIIKKPGILAGIVGGAIIGILTAILLIMFIVYRMRKKDEGSYALEETKKPLNAYDYRHCPTKEFYA